jgi:hypothetical protein
LDPGKPERFDESIADYDAALRINPKQAESLYGRGTAKLRQGDSAGGNADIITAKKDPGRYRRGIHQIWGKLVARYPAATLISAS